MKLNIPPWPFQVVFKKMYVCVNYLIFFLNIEIEIHEAVNIWLPFVSVRSLNINQICHPSSQNSRRQPPKQ